MQFIITQDGTPTIYDTKYQEHHHSLIGAYTEARYKFVEMALPIIKQKSRIQLLDLPFGLGYNLIATLKTIHDLKLSVFLESTAIENDFEIIKQIAELAKNQEIWKDNNIDLNHYFSLIAGHSNQVNHIERANFTSSLIIDDLLRALPKLTDNSFDIIYYDSFSPRVVPALWSKESVLFHLNRILKVDGILITYTASNKVRKGLLELGLNIAPSNPVGRKMPGTIASKKALSLLFRESQIESFSEETMNKIKKAQSY